MIIKTISNEWNVNKIDFHVFNDIEIKEVFINIKDNIFNNIYSMLSNTSYIYVLSINDIINAYKVIDYLQIERLMEPCAIKISQYMNNCNRVKLVKILNKFNLSSYSK
jgi:ABC-type amino acid transport system permease subunit